jgi:hypothetical protein
LIEGIYRGVTYFDEALAFFAANFDTLAKEFIKMKGYDMKLESPPSKENTDSLLKIH